MIVLIDVCNAMQNFFNVYYSNYEQHVDAKACRVSRDSCDLQKLLDSLKIHNPFPVTENIMSIISGAVGGLTIKCYKDYEVGQDCVSLIIGQYFGTVKFER